MSEFTNNNEIKLKKLLELSEVIINKLKPAEYVKANMDTIDAIMPSDVIILVHQLVEKGYPMDELKKHISKLLNLFYKALNNYPTPEPTEKDLLYWLQKNNKIMEEKLVILKAPIKSININGVNAEDLELIKSSVEEMQAFSDYYTIKENVLFPMIEKYWEDYKCVQIMWSIHDDVRSYLKEIPEIIAAKEFDLKRFNRVSSKLYFDVKAIKFRDEKILFPQILLTIPKEEMQQLLFESADFKFPFINPKIDKEAENKNNLEFIDGEVNLGTGSMSPEQIALIFNHLPVDITYVDENDTVKYFSTPKHRIFPRTNAIIGRHVQNCHPPESVHIVEQIVDAFKAGKKDVASFWIKMGPYYVLIKYFAVRDKEGIFRGTLEVSQEISDIQKIKGDKRLLDWE